MRVVRTAGWSSLTLIAVLIIAPTPFVRAEDNPLPETAKPSSTGSAPQSSGSGIKVELTPVRPSLDTAEVQRRREGISRLVAEADSALKARGGSRADEAQLFLSWNAPWGDRRATTGRMPACRDSVSADTLYLTMKAGRSSERFTGFTSQVVVHATGADTLGPWWHMESRGGANPGSMRIEWAGGSEWARTHPFRSEGQGVVLLDHNQTTARLRMVYAVPYDQAAPIAADSLYSLARIILRHRPDRQLAGCDQPTVIEWLEATLAFGAKDEPTVRRGERFVVFSGPHSLLESWRGRRVESWKPKTAGR